MKRLAWLLCALTFGCGSASVVQTARHGDLGALKREIAAEQRAGRLDRALVLDLAAAVAGRELYSAKGSAGAAVVQSLRGCAGPLLPLLEIRAGRGDEGGAQALLVLYEMQRRTSAPLVAAYKEAPSGAFRAVAARASVAPEHALLRRSYFRDPDERVRHAALLAARHARDPADLEDLLEAARLDPNLSNRGAAVLAIGEIGGEAAVLRLKDRWARADQPTRLAILEAWTLPASYTAGGKAQIVSVAETGRGTVAIFAAVLLLEDRAPAAPELAKAVLVQAIKDGTEEEQRLAIRLAPLSDARVEKIVAQATRHDNLEVRVMALARALDVPELKKRATAELGKLAKGTDSVAFQARAGLAAAGEPSVAPLLVRDLTAPFAARRQVAALGLLRLERFASAATALADDDPRVRRAIACSALRMASRSADVEFPEPRL